MNTRLQMLFSRRFRDEANVDGDGGAAPAAATAAAPASEGQDVNTDWGAMADDSVAAEPAETTPAVEAQPSTPAEPPAAPPATEPTAQPPAQPPAAAAQQPPEGQPPAESAEPAQPTEQQIAEMRQQAATQLEQYYAMDPDTAARLQTEPELVLPKLAAQLHMTVMDAVIGQLPARVGHMIQSYNESVKRETEAKGKFFDAYPELKDYEQQVRQAGQMYRAANPTATAEQAVKAIGEFVMHSLGITRAPQGQPQQQQIQQQAAFVPATTSGAGAVPPVKSEWEAMIEPD